MLRLRDMRLAGRWSVVVLLVLAVALFGLAAGCRRGGTGGAGDGTSDGGAGGSGGQPATVAVTAFFSDKDGQYLWPEQRQVPRPAGGAADLAAAALRELIAGPREAGHVATIPEGAQLLGVKLDGGTALVDFSRELQTKHWGGSTGEIMTVYSIVNTVTGIEGIASVRLFLEGQPLDSLVGHLDLTGPLTRDENLIKK